MFTPSLLLPHLISQAFPTRFLLAYSGGLDSSVLLDALIELLQQKKIQQLRVVHINHGWHPNASQWATACQATCKQLGVDCEVVVVNAQPESGESPEACARLARYTVFEKMLLPDECLLTAHQQDDQAETLLLQLFRGAGVKGLASMPIIKAFGRGYHLRPLLDFTRAELHAYAAQRNLAWIEDDSNKNTRFDRNFVRHELMLPLQQRWPQITNTLARVVGHCAEAEKLINVLAAEDLLRVQGSQAHSLSISKLKMLDAVRWRNVLRFWIQTSGFSLPSQAQLQEIENIIFIDRKDAMPKVTWGKVEVRRYRDDLYVLAKSVLQNRSSTIPWNFQQPLTLPDIGVLAAQLRPGVGICQEKLQLDKMSVRFRMFGERCQPAGRQGSHPLKKLFQEWGVPPWQRHSIPLLYCGEQLVAVIGYCICDDFTIGAGKLGWEVILQKVPGAW